MKFWRPMQFLKLKREMKTKEVLTNSANMKVPVFLTLPLEVLETKNCQVLINLMGMITLI